MWSNLSILLPQRQCTLMLYIYSLYQDNKLFTYHSTKHRLSTALGDMQLIIPSAHIFPPTHSQLQVSTSAHNLFAKSSCCSHHVFTSYMSSATSSTE